MTSESQSFIYRDAKGNISLKEVTEISENEIYIQALCLNAGELRTYRKDRILEFIVDREHASERIQHYQATLPPPSHETHRPSWKRNTTGALEICFTGFKAADKESLQKLAEDNGFLVRQAVTAQVSILVGGYNAGPAKTERARHQGAMILSEHQFKMLLETGEIPVECAPAT